MATVPSVWSVCFIKGNTNSGPVVYTVPPGRTAVVTDVELYSGANIPDRVGRFIDHDTAQTITARTATTSGDQWWGSWVGRQAFGPGQSFAISSANGPVDGRVCGYFLEGAAPADLTTVTGS